MGMGREDIRLLSDDALAEYDMLCVKVARLEAADKALSWVNAQLLALQTVVVILLREINNQCQKPHAQFFNAEFFRAVEDVEALVSSQQQHKSQ